MSYRCERCNSPNHTLDNCQHNEPKKYTEAELQEKLRPLRNIYTRMTNCDYYGEDGELKGKMVPFELLHELEAALDNNGEKG